MTNIHATCVEVSGRGVLLTGRPGSGKSDLALRLIDPDGAAVRSRLVADDRVVVENREGRLAARAPDNLHGLLEVRGVGIIEMEAVREAEILVAIDLDADDRPERLPDFNLQTITLEGVTLPLARLAPFEASAPAKVRALVRALGQAPVKPPVQIAGER